MQGFVISNDSAKEQWPQIGCHKSYETRFESENDFEVGSGLSDENFIQMLMSHYKVQELTLSIPSEKF